MKRLSKKLVTLMGVGLCAMTLTMSLNIPVYASTGEAEVASEEDTRATNLEWYYKYIDGVLMMRLFNHTTGEWVGDWIPAVG